MSTMTEWINTSPERQRTFAQERLIVDVSEEIWAAMRRTKTTKADLARHLGCSKSHVSQILNGRRNMTLRSLSDICFFLGLQPSFIVSRLPITGPGRT